MRLLVGCCGWCVGGGRRGYFQSFETIEIQETFYKLPRPETVKRWRSEAPPGFVFNIKAWQVITHPPSSPTWRRSGIKVEGSKADLYGHLKPTRENLEAWNRTCEVAEAVSARVIVVQTPPSFGYSAENARNVEEFFSEAKRPESLLGWEPRGDWREHLDEVRRICGRLDLIHVTDPFRSESVSDHHVCYFRLHGIGGRETNYSYRYTVDDLRRLLEIVVNEEKKGRDEIYVMFNNVSMMNDAAEFRKLASELF